MNFKPKPKQPKAPWYIAKHGNATAKKTLRPIARRFFGRTPRKRVSAVSDRQKVRNAVYRRAKAEYMAAHPVCENGAHAPSKDLHHTRGRAGTLLWDQRFFKALCRSCHDWVQQYPEEARELGLLCAVGQWNTVPKDRS